MSYGIIRIQKMTAGSCKGIEIHDKRQREGVSHTNKDIDWERTKDNYSLMEQKEQTFYRSVQDRIAELDLKRAVRKDAIVMAQALVTSDTAFFEGKGAAAQRQFFEESLRFLEKKYGKENIISATVHMDEKTPHMHVNFVPVTPDGRLSARDLFNRKSLTELQDQYHDEVGRQWGLDRGERGSSARHLETAEYKAQAFERAAADRAQEAEKARQEAERAREEAERAKEAAKAAQAKSAAIQQQIDANTRYINHISNLPQGKKTLTGDVKFTEEEAKALIETAKRAYSAMAKERSAVQHANDMYDRMQRLEKSTTHEEMQRLTDENKDLAAKVKELPGLKEKCEQLEGNLNWYKTFYDDQILNIIERVGDKDKEWLLDTVIPKWAGKDFEKDLADVLYQILHPKLPGLDLSR